MRIRLGIGLLLLLHPAIAPADDFAHGSKIIDAFDGLDLKFAIVGFLHGAVFPNHHGGDRFRALDVGDVEALDAPGQVGQRQQILQRFLDHLARRLQHAEALIETLLGILPREVDQGTLLSAAGHAQLHFVLCALAQQGRERSAIGKIDRYVDRARHVLLVDIELLQQGGEKEGSVKGFRSIATGSPPCSGCVLASERFPRR